MSTIASLLGMLGDTQIRPWDVATRSQNEADTGLIELQQLKEKQQAEQLMLERIKQDPVLAQQLLGGGPVLGSLGQPAVPPGGALTQQGFGPGGPSGPAQVVPGGQDLSQFATQGTPQSTLASLGPAGQPQMQPALGPNPGAPQRNPVLEMAATNPRAAMMLSQQMEQRQDAQMKRQEQNMKLGAATLGYVGQQAQGVTDQASLDALRSDLQSQGLGKYAAQLPQLYSKGAMEPFIAKALDVKESLTLQIADMDSQRKALAAHQKNLLDQQQHGEKMTLEREKMGQQQTQQTQQTQQQTRSAEFNLQGEYNKLALPYREVRDAMGRIEAAGTSPTAAGDAALITAYMKMLDPTTGVRDAEVRNAQSVGGLPQQAAGWLEWLRGGAPLKDGVRKDFMERAQKLYAQYQKDYEQVGTQYREQAERQGLDPRNVVQDYRSTTPAGGRTGKPVAQMNAEETRAEIAAIKARGGR